jgi:CheY-like chemotaxis protein
MPVMTGLEALESLPNDPDTADIPAVLASGSVPQAEAAGVLNDGDQLVQNPRRHNYRRASTPRWNTPTLTSERSRSGYFRLRGGHVIVDEHDDHPTGREGLA